MTTLAIIIYIYIYILCINHAPVWDIGYKPKTRGRAVEHDLDNLRHRFQGFLSNVCLSYLSQVNRLAPHAGTLYNISSLAGIMVTQMYIYKYI